MDDEIEAALCREWRGLRDAGALDFVLPACGTRQWMRDDGCVGYVTLDFSVQPNVEFPGACRSAPGVASIVEKYWSVRTINGQQDPNWRPSLNVHVVHVRNRAVIVDDAEDLFRNASIARQAVLAAGRHYHHPVAHVEVYVRAVLLGASVDDGVNLLCQGNTFRDIPFCAGKFSFSLAEGFSFGDIENDERFDFELGLFHQPEIAELGERLIGDDLLPLQNFVWSGTNTGPVYDRTTGLTTHDGKVL